MHYDEIYLENIAYTPSSEILGIQFEDKINFEWKQKAILKMFCLMENASKNFRDPNKSEFARLQTESANLLLDDLLEVFLAERNQKIY